jgi:hypothetical protein
MNALMPTRVATAVRIVPVTVRQRLDQMVRNVTTACASLATALREVLHDRFWESPRQGGRLPSYPSYHRHIMEAIHGARACP